MRRFDYNLLKDISLDSSVVNLTAKIYEYKGKQDMYTHIFPEKLTTLLEVAKIHSVEASIEIEGKVTTQKKNG